MEKRIVLAFVLSFAVLIGWQKMFPSPKAGSTVINTQTIETRAVTGNFDQKFGVERVRSLGEKKERRPGVEVTLANEKIDLKFSTNGGGIIGATILQYDAQLPIRDVLDLVNFQNLEYKVEREEAAEVVFSAKQQGIEIRKTYRLLDDDYILSSHIQIKNISSSPISLNPSVQTMLIDLETEGENVPNSRDRNLMEYSVLSQEKVIRKTGAYKFLPKERKQVSATVDWFGFRNRYFCVIVKPEFDVQGYEFLPQAGEKQLKMNAMMKDVIINPGESIDLSSIVYVGPQNSKILKEYGEGFEKFQVYFRWTFFDSIAKIIEDAMRAIYKVIPNWGIAIILGSMAIYLMMYPMTMKSMLSMRKMQSLQPKIAELREKHEKDPQRLNKEIMKMYKENKVNPIGGCLPLLLQMPIFICLYQMIWRSILFKGAGFLWIKDLSLPDRLSEMKTNLPMIDNFTGGYFNLLPIIILILMVVQQKMTAKNMGSKDPNQIAQQKMMTFMMPIVLLLVFYKVASGLSLYLTVFYLLSSFTQWRVAQKSKAEA